MKLFIQKITFMAGLILTSIGVYAKDTSVKQEIKSPQIPDSGRFVWEGTFRSNGPTPAAQPVTAPLLIQGEKNGRFFNLYMQQGTATDPNVWVENLIYENKMYSITHRWHGVDQLKLCFRADDITVADLNNLLKSSQFVALETIEGQQMNHFRTSCLSTVTIKDTNISTRMNIFSDIYVNPNNEKDWKRWLQFGDGVGLDIHHDEWFILGKDKNKNANEIPKIKLPQACENAIVIPIVQGPCTNLPHP